MSSKRHRHRRQGGTTPTTEPPNSPGVAQFSVSEVAQFSVSLDTLRDRTARARIDIRIRRLSLGNSGDIRPVGDGVSELRIHYGPGYRIYLTKQGDAVVILLAGGDKSSQDKDIRLAKDLARNL